jgi:hypothetical protein
MIKETTDITTETVAGPIRIFAVLLRLLFLVAAILCFVCAVETGTGLVQATVFFGLACAITIIFRVRRRKAK